MHVEEYLWEQGETDVQATITFFNKKDSAVVSLYISGLNTSGLLKMWKVESSFLGGSIGSALKEIIEGLEKLRGVFRKEAVNKSAMY